MPDVFQRSGVPQAQRKPEANRRRWQFAHYGGDHRELRQQRSGQFWNRFLILQSGNQSGTDSESDEVDTQGLSGSTVSGGLPILHSAARVQKL